MLSKQRIWVAKILNYIQHGNVDDDDKYFTVCVNDKTYLRE